MEELREESCSTNSKKYCKKGIIILIVSSLFFFLLGYYFGNKTNSKIQRVVSSGINRPFPHRVPNIPNISKIQKPQIQRMKPPTVPQKALTPIPEPSQNIQKKESPKPPKTKQTSNKKVATNKK
jgi:hypothetical protein